MANNDFDMNEWQKTTIGDKDKFRLTDHQKMIAAQIEGNLLEIFKIHVHELESSGMTFHEAASTMAWLGIRVSWQIASAGAISNERIPDPEKFQSIVKNIVTPSIKRKLIT